MPMGHRAHPLPLVKDPAGQPKPPGAGAQDGEPGALNVAGGQSWHTVAFALLKVFAGQGKHWGWPGEGEYLPALHAVQVSADTAATTLLAVPAGHKVHCLGNITSSPAHVPGGHGKDKYSFVVAELEEQVYPALL